MVSSKPVLVKALQYGAMLALVITLAGGAIGYVIDSWIGMASAFIGAVMAFVFLGITAGSILFANRFSASPIFTALFFMVVLGAWLLKFVVFLVVIFLLKDQEWINSVVLYFSLIVGVLGTLVVDVVVAAKTRVPYVSDVVLSGDANDPPTGRENSS